MVTRVELERAEVALLADLRAPDGGDAVSRRTDACEIATHVGLLMEAVEALAIVEACRAGLIGPRIREASEARPPTLRTRVRVVEIKGARVAAACTAPPAWRADGTLDGAGKISTRPVVAGGARNRSG